MLGVKVHKHSRRAETNAPFANVRASILIKDLLLSCSISEICQLSITAVLTAAMRLWLDVSFSTTWGLEQVLSSFKDNLQTVNQFLPIWKGGDSPPWSTMRTRELGQTLYWSLASLPAPRNDDFQWQVALKRVNLVPDCLIRKGKSIWTWEFYSNSNRGISSNKKLVKCLFSVTECIYCHLFWDNEMLFQWPSLPGISKQKANSLSFLSFCRAPNHTSNHFRSH